MIYSAGTLVKSTMDAENNSADFAIQRTKLLKQLGVKAPSTPTVVGTVKKTSAPVATAPLIDITVAGGASLPPAVAPASSSPSSSAPPSTSGGCTGCKKATVAPSILASVSAPIVGDPIITGATPIPAAGISQPKWWELLAAVVLIASLLGGGRK